MKTNLASIDRGQPDKCQCALRSETGSWQLTFEGRHAAFKHELGALYVAWLLLEPPREPIHGVALALKARESLARVDAAQLSLVGTRSTASPYSQEVKDAVERVPTIPGESDEALRERAMGLEDAASIRALWRRQRELERVLEDRLVLEPVKAEALRELEEITEHLRKSPWLSRRGAERCARAVAAAIKHLRLRLAGALDPEGRRDEVLRAFAVHPHSPKPSPHPMGRGCFRAARWGRGLGRARDNSSAQETRPRLCSPDGGGIHARRYELGGSVVPACHWGAHFGESPRIV